MNLFAKQLQISSKIYDMKIAAHIAFIERSENKLSVIFS